MAALKKMVDVALCETGAFAGENVGLVSSTCLDGTHEGGHVSLYSSTCISSEATDMHGGAATHMVSSTCLEQMK